MHGETCCTRVFADSSGWSKIADVNPYRGVNIGRAEIELRVLCQLAYELRKFG